MENALSKHMIFWLALLSFSLGACTPERKQSEYGEYWGSQATTVSAVAQKDTVSTTLTDSTHTVPDTTIKL